MAIPQGTAERKAVEIAIEEINAKGGILGIPLKMVVGDDKLNPDQSAAEFRRLATVEKADFIVGGFSSGVMLATMEAMAETKTLYFGIASSPAHSAKVSKEYEKYKYWFRAGFNNGTTFAWDIIDIVDYLNNVQKMDIKKVYIIRDEHIWTDPVMKLVSPALEERGIEIVSDTKLPRGFTDYEQLFLDAQSKKADLILAITALVGTEDVMVKTWSELQVPILLAGHIIDAIAPDFYERTDGAAAYVVFIADGGVVATAPPTDLAAKFIDKYKEKYGALPESFFAYPAYDMVYVYKAAVEAAAAAGEKNPFDPDVVIKYVEKFNTNNPIKLTRVIAWHKNHDQAWGDKYQRNWPSQWHPDGKAYVIWPENVANGEFLLPPWIKK
jgi:branched-chain amino acid transport system substrate-binding protein